MEKLKTCTNNDNVIFQRYLIYCSGDIHVIDILLHFTMKGVSVGRGIHRKENFVETKGVIGNRKSEKNRQHIGLKKTDIRTNNDIQNNSSPPRHFMFKCPCQEYYKSLLRKCGIYGFSFYHHFRDFSYKTSILFMKHFVVIQWKTEE